MNLYKIEAYTREKKPIRVCLNFVCSICYQLALEDYKIKILAHVSTTGKKAYWCDNCLVGNDHPKYEKQMIKNLKRKGELI